MSFRASVKATARLCVVVVVAALLHASVPAGVEFIEQIDARLLRD
jgi:hypothetical protein